MEFTYESLQLAPKLPKNMGMKIGIIGTGAVVRSCHLPAYKSCGFNVHGITSLSMDESQELAEEYGIEKVYVSKEMLMDDPEIEILDIAVPPRLQPEIVKYACENSRNHIKGILCQKPLAMDLDAAREIVSICEKYNMPVGVNHNMRTDPAIKCLKTILDRGYLGKPVCANFDLHHCFDWQTYADELKRLVVQTYGIHHIDAARYLFGEPTKVNAICRKDPNLSYHHIDGISQYNLIYEDGFIMSSFDDAYGSPNEGVIRDSSINWRVAGTEGFAKGTIGWVAGPYKQPSELCFASKQYPEKLHNPTWTKTWLPDAFVETMADVMIAVEEGTTPKISGKDNLNTIAVLEAVYKSIAEERTVYVSEI